MKRKLTDNEEELLKLTSCVYGGDNLPEPKTATINGREFTVSYQRVLRQPADTNGAVQS